MSKFTGRRIRRENLADGVSVEYYSPEYVQWLEGEIEQLRSAQNKFWQAAIAAYHSQPGASLKFWGLVEAEIKRRKERDATGESEVSDG